MKKLMKLVVMMLIIVAILLISNAVLAISVDIDKTASEKVLKTGESVNIVLTLDEAPKSNTEIPTLKIKIGNGAERSITTGTVSDSKITYKYTVASQDKGPIKFVELSGFVTYEDGEHAVGVDNSDGAFDNAIKVYANSKEAGTISGGENNNGSALKWEDGKKVKASISFKNVTNVTRRLYIKDRRT